MQNSLFETEKEQTPPSSGVPLNAIVSKPLLLHGDCRKYLFDLIEADSIDLTVTSPPYDNLRTYNNSSTWGWAEFSSVAAGLWRVTKPGGVVVWVVGDATVKGSETGSSFEQALAFKKMGFNLHDTMIYQKNNFASPSSNRYHQTFEYAFVFSKGSPANFNGIKDRKNVTAGEKGFGKNTKRNRSGTLEEQPNKVRSEFGLRHNVWLVKTGFNVSTADKEAYKHPAIFPEKLAHGHIISWSNEGDTVFDPFLGSGTTGKMAKLLNRKFIGIEIDLEYYQIATKRIEAC